MGRVDLFGGIKCNDMRVFVLRDEWEVRERNIINAHWKNI